MKTYKGNPFDKPQEKKQCDIHVVTQKTFVEEQIERTLEIKQDVSACG